MWEINNENVFDVIAFNDTSLHIKFRKIHFHIIVKTFLKSENVKNNEVLKLLDFYYWK